MKYKSIKPKKVYEEVTDAILEMIKSGELKRGDKLDSVDKLAKNFEVSRSAVRESLSGLRAMGMVEMKQGEGTYISEFDAAKFSLSVQNGLLMNKKNIEELFQVRKILEAGSAGLAAENHSLEDLKKIEEALMEMKKDKGNGEVGEEADLKFHLAIANATHNEILINLIKSVSDAMVLSMWETRKLLYDSEEKMASLFEAHQLIFDAIKIKDVNLATEQMYHHLTVTEQVQFEYRDE